VGVNASRLLMAGLVTFVIVMAVLLFLFWKGW
jgi:hypothetical protein